MSTYEGRYFITTPSEDVAQAALEIMMEAIAASPLKDRVKFDGLKEMYVGKETLVYTDGGCDNAKGGGHGAWAFYAEQPGLPPVTGVGGDPLTTNNRMELQAVIEALNTLEIGQKIVIHCDSKYVINGATTWAKNWVRNGWVTRQGSPVINQDLWKELLDLYALHDVRFVHVYGHSGVVGNEWCDAACTDHMKTMFATEIGKQREA